MKNLLKFLVSGLYLLFAHNSFALDLPEGCAEITSYLQSNSEKFKTYDRITTLPDSAQRIAFSLLTPEQKVIFLNDFLQTILKRKDLKLGQRSFIDLLRNEVTTDFVTNPSATTLRAYEDMAVVLFGIAAAQILDPGLPAVADKSTIDQMSSDSSPTDYSCNCSDQVSFSTCSGEGPRGHAMRCVSNKIYPDMCTELSKGCGFLWLTSCNGECYCTYQDRYGQPYEVPCRPGRNTPKL